MASSSSSAWDAPGGGPAGGGRRRGPRGNYGGSEVVLRAAGPAPAPSGGPHDGGGWSPYEDCHAGAGAGAGGGREGEGRRKEGRAWLYFKAKAGRRATGGTWGTLPLSRRDKARGFGPQRASRHGRQGRRRWRPELPGPAEAPAAPAKPGWVLTPRAYAGGRPVAEGVEGTAGPVTENVTPRKDEAAELGELASPRAEGGEAPKAGEAEAGGGDEPEDPSMSFLMRKYDLDDDQLKMLYLIDLMTRGEPVKFVGEDGEDKESFRWVRELAVLIYTYEGVVMGIFDYDYAPAPFKVASKRMYLNISQDGKDDVTDLRERNLVVGLKVTSQTYTNSVVFRLSELGEDCLKECMTDEIRADIDRLFYRADGKPGSKLMPSAVEFDEEEEKFKITTPGGYLEWSTITEVEAVSYVSSPYIPAHLRHFGEEASSNADRIDEMKNAISDIKDEDLSENITLDEVLLAVVEWVPMGGNQIVSLNDTLGSSERIQGGFFTAMVDEAPDETQFQGSSEGLTCVNLLDYAEASYANFEAEVYFPAEEGVIQVEMFGMHFSDTGCMNYGLDINAIMDRVRDSISLDLMSRLLVDVHNDSSEVVTPLFTAHQRALLDLTFLGDSENRDKFNVICAERIHPKEKAEFYMDKEDNENELKQVLGDTQTAHDLGEDELIVIGMFGILVAGTDSKRHQPLLQAYAGLKARNIFMKAVSARCYIVADALQQTRVLIDTYYEDPESVDKIRELISECTEHVINLSEIQVFLVESCEALREENVGPIPGDRASEDLAEVLSIPFLLDCTWKRAGDIEKTIDGCRNDLTALREMSNSISEVRNQTTDEKLEANTKNLEDISRASARNDAASFEILNVIFAGSIAFQILDRVFGTYMGVADQIGWVEDYIRPYTINVPMIWFIINMVVWVGFGAFVIGLLRYKGYLANAAEAVTTTLALPVDMDKLRKFLKGKPITSEEITQDEKSLIKKYQWDEEEPKRWNGEPPRFELKVDERFGFILQIFITIVMRKSKLNCNAALEMILQELQDAGVVQAGVSATQLKVTEDVPPKGGSLPSSPSLSRQQSSVSN